MADTIDALLAGPSRVLTPTRYSDEIRRPDAPLAGPSRARSAIRYSDEIQRPNAPLAGPSRVRSPVRYSDEIQRPDAPFAGPSSVHSPIRYSDEIRRPDAPLAGPSRAHSFTRRTHSIPSRGRPLTRRSNENQRPEYTETIDSLSISRLVEEDNEPPRSKFKEMISRDLPEGLRGSLENDYDAEEIRGLVDDLWATEGLEPIVEEGEPKDEAVRTVPDILLQTSHDLGLDDEQVSARRRTYGMNQMKEESPNKFKKFSMFFRGPIQYVMEVALILALILQDWIDVGVIVGLLLVNAIVGFAQEAHAGNIVKELKKTLALKCTVVRNGGTPLEVDAPTLVPGDVVRLEEGSIVPADGRLIVDGAYLQVDQSAVTGESLAVEKHYRDLIYQSSAIKRGESLMMVTATGDRTFVGRSAALVNAASAGTGHFTQVLSGIGGVLLTLVILTLLVVWVSSFYRSQKTLKILEFTLAITMIGVPVGLPAVVTTTMAVGAAYLAKKQAIVQKLAAIESLAGVEILCSDKTGTLTKNKLTLGDPYTVGSTTPDELMVVACMAASRKKMGLDAIDKAFLRALRLYPGAMSLLSQFRVVEFTPFDPVSKIVIAIVESSRGDLSTCVKGAPPAVIKMVTKAQKVPEATMKEYNDKVAEFAIHGLRSLGVARKRYGGPWEILGIVPCSDLPRYDTCMTIAEAKDLGLKIKMLTGDAIGIAKETSRLLGLGENVYKSERLGLSGDGEMPGSRVFDFVEAADGFAEVFPQHKYNVVDILQQRGYLVAMTGDGVNDAPSLKKADCGIAVGGASDAARSAADIVFLAPGLHAIIDAIKTSRQIFHRMHAYIVYRIALSLHLELFFGLWIAILNDSLRIQLVVFIAIFADIATLAIAYDNAPYSKVPAKWNLPKLWGTAILMGIILAVGSWICLSTLRAGKFERGIAQQPVHVKEEERVNQTDSILFLQIVLTENWLILITRASGPSKPSWQLILAILFVDVLATFFALFGWLNGLDGKSNSIYGVLALHPWTVGRVWVFSLFVTFMMAVVYYIVANSVAFDRIMHGKWPCKTNRKKRSTEDFDVAMTRISSQHERLM